MIKFHLPRLKAVANFELKVAKNLKSFFIFQRIENVGMGEKC